MAEIGLWGSSNTIGSGTPFRTVALLLSSFSAINSSAATHRDVAVPNGSPFMKWEATTAMGPGASIGTDPDGESRSTN